MLRRSERRQCAPVDDSERPDFQQRYISSRILDSVPRKYILILLVSLVNALWGYFQFVFVAKDILPFAFGVRFGRTEYLNEFFVLDDVLQSRGVPGDM